MDVKETYLINVYDRKNKKYQSVEITVEINVREVAERMVSSAFHNKNKKSEILHGAVKVHI